MRGLVLGVGAVAALVIPVSAQTTWSGGPGVGLAAPVGTMGNYLASGLGLSIMVRRHGAPVTLRADWRSVSFGEHLATRPLNGSGPPVGIRSSAKLLVALAGPEATLSSGRWRFALAGQAGAAHVQATGSAALPGDPRLAQRAGSYATLTWVAGLAAGASVRVGRTTRVGLDLSLLQLGRAKFLREYNLPIGVISGIYLNPTPYAPRFGGASLSVSLPM